MRYVVLGCGAIGGTVAAGLVRDGHDVLVSDAVSPDRDAYALVGKVQSLEADRGGRIPALALTRMSQTDAETKRLLSDVQRDLPKPVEPAVLTAEVARLAGRERRRSQRH